MWRRIKSRLIMHLRSRVWLYSIILFLFCAGLNAGFSSVGILGAEQRGQLHQSLSLWVRAGADGGIRVFSVLWRALWQNMVTLALIAALGLTILGIPLILIAIILRGFAMGFSIAGVFSQWGFLTAFRFAFCSVLQSVLYIISYSFLSACALINAWRSFQSFHRQLQSQRMQRLRPYFIDCLVAAGICAAACIVESVLAPSTAQLFR